MPVITGVKAGFVLCENSKNEMFSGRTELVRIIIPAVDINKHSVKLFFIYI